MILEVTLSVAHEVADARTQRVDATAAERNALGEIVTVVDMSVVAVARKSIRKPPRVSLTVTRHTRGNK